MPHRILVVDDNQINLDLVGRILRLDGHEVILVTSGELALEQVNNMDPDLVILDMMMPRMDGFELCARLRQIKKCRDIPIIMLTASSGEEDRRKAIDAGVNIVLGKPFDMETLQKQVGSLIPQTQKVGNKNSRAP